MGKRHPVIMTRSVQTLFRDSIMVDKWKSSWNLDVLSEVCSCSLRELQQFIGQFSN